MPIQRPEVGSHGGWSGLQRLPSLSGDQHGLSTMDLRSNSNYLLMYEGSCFQVHSGTPIWGCEIAKRLFEIC